MQLEDWYVVELDSSILQRRPMLAQCTTAAVLFGTGDVIAQQAVEKRGRNHDVGYRPSII